MTRNPPGTKISLDQLHELPYVSAVPKDGRIVPLLTFYDEETDDWNLYVRHGESELVRLAEGEVIDGSYLGRIAADVNRDIEFPLATLLIQRLSFPDILGALGRLENGVHRCAQILQKYQLFWDHRQNSHLSAPLLVESELEYLLLLLRSFYDQLQKVVRAMWRHSAKPDRGGAPVPMNDLPATFSKMVMDGEDVLASSELIQRYGIPRHLAVWYEVEAPFFRILRDLRDGIAHHGRRLPIIFETSWGFAVDPSDRPWSLFEEWNEERFRKGRLGSLRKVVGGFIGHVLGATSRLVLSINESAWYDPPLAENLRYFIRSSFGQNLVGLDFIVEQPWEGKNGAPD